MARPREFDEDDVLDRALHLFWEKGYEGTSLNDLLDATALTKSSLYKAFGSKERLFERVRARYHSKYLKFKRDALDQPTPRRITEHLLLGMVDLHLGSVTPPGCLETNAAIACSMESESVRLTLAGERLDFVSLLSRRFDATRAAGSLPAGMTSRDAALLVVSLIQGMALLAKSGATRKDLLRLAKSFLLAWSED